MLPTTRNLGFLEWNFCPLQIRPEGFTIEPNYITLEGTGLSLVVFNNRLSLYMSPRSKELKRETIPSSAIVIG